jgi:hypothetical protein
MALNTRSLDDLSVEVDHGLTVREIEGSLGVHLSPDEHIFRRERDLAVAIADICLNSAKDPFLRKIYLGVEIRQTELAPSAATGGHFDNTEGRSFVGKENAVAILGMADIHLGGQVFAVDRAAKAIQRVGRFAPSFDYPIDSELTLAAGLRDLPPA